jgi:hypothetical protein
MATPYSAGDLSRAQSSQTCRRPAASGPGAPGPSTTAGLPSPNVPGAILIVSASTTHRIWGGREGAGEKAGPGGPLSCIRILK